jgi:predicted RNA-binding protein with PUA-like domain
MAKRQHWLIKSEPDDYPYEQLERDRKTAWSGIRNFQARNVLKAMRSGDLALYYHTGDERQVVAVARIASGPHPDRTAKQGEEWFAVDVEPDYRLDQPVTLAQLKADKALAELPLLRQGRLSVTPVTLAQFKAILRLGKKKR